MKKCPILSFLIFMVTLFSSYNIYANHPSNIPKLDPEMTGKEYLRVIEKNYGNNKRISFLSDEDEEIEKFLAIGKRNLQWIDFVNSFRDPSQRLSLTSRSTEPGYPLSNPRIYNFEIIKDKWKIAIDSLPKTLRDVLIDGAPFTVNFNAADSEFIERLFAIDGAYQVTARYFLMKDWKDEMSESASYDIRGYVNLLNEKDIDQKLNDWNALSILMHSHLSHDLILICLNSEKELSICMKEFDDAVKGHAVRAFKDRYMAAGEELYRSFFNLRQARPDGLWTSSDINNMTVPFANPHNEVILNFLKENIEDEWSWNGWHLHLNFVESDSPDMTHIVFKPGAVPHVSNSVIITMDENAPLTEYDVQWSIRHEYGHILGFPDCYFEFYDKELEAFVSYQLDVTNLMCSRQGKLKQTHYDELKKYYLK